MGSPFERSKGKLAAHIGETPKRGNTEGREHVVETFFARRARALPVVGEQRSLVIGSLLGDGTLLKTTSGFCFRVHHGRGQKSLVDHKYRLMVDFVRSEPRASGSGIYFRTVSHPAFAELRAQFYEGKRKIVPGALLERELDARALAVWVMDDGAADGRQLRLNTQCFEADEVSELATILRANFGIESRANIDKGRFRLRCCASTMDRLRSIVAPYMIPEMLYKLSL